MKTVGFKEENFYLSNFYNHPVKYDGIMYRNNVSAYLAQHFEKEQRGLFTKLLPMQAIRLFNKIKHVTEFTEEEKLKLMKSLLEIKFLDINLKEKLMANDTELINENTWNDTFWGTTDGKGKNYTGKILMSLRERYRTEKSKEEEKIEKKETFKNVTEEVKTDIKKKRVKKNAELDRCKSGTGEEKPNSEAE